MFVDHSNVIHFNQQKKKFQMIIIKERMKENSSNKHSKKKKKRFSIVLSLSVISIWWWYIMWWWSSSFSYDIFQLLFLWFVSWYHHVFLTFFLFDNFLLEKKQKILIDWKQTWMNVFEGKEINHNFCLSHTQAQIFLRICCL